MKREVTFQFPLKVSVTQELLDLLLMIAIVPSPWAIFAFYYIFLSDKLDRIYGYIAGFISLGLFLYVLSRCHLYTPVGFKFYRERRSILYRKYILENIRCPNCGSKFQGWVPLTKYAYGLSDYAFICGGCGKEYVPDVVEDSLTKRTIWTLKEARRKVTLKINDLYLRKAVNGKGYTLYLNLTIRNNSKSKMSIFGIYVTTNKNKAHACVFDRVVESEDSFDEGSPMDLPPRSTIEVTAKTFDLEKIDESLSKDEIPLKFFYKLYDYDQDFLYPEYNVSIPRKLIEEMKDQGNLQ